MKTLTYKEALGLLRVSESKWKKTKNKHLLFASEGYRLVSIKKEGRSTLYEIEEPREATEQLRRLILDEHNFNIANKNIMSFVELMLIFWQEGVITNPQGLAAHLGISTTTFYDWRQQMSKKGLLTVSKRNVVILYYDYNDREVGDEKDWQDWIDYLTAHKNLSYAESVQEYRVEVGFFPYRTASIEGNGFQEEFFQLLFSLTQEVDEEDTKKANIPTSSPTNSYISFI